MRPAAPLNWTWCIAGLVGVYCVVTWLACRALDFAGLFQPTMYFKGYFCTYLIVIVPYLIGGAWRSGRGPRLFSLIRLPQHDLAESWRRVVMALPLLLSMPLFMAAFTAMKNLISLTIPFTWDLYLTELDAAIHFGKQPWELLGIQNWYLTRLIDLLYIAWVSLLALVFAFVALRAPEDPVRNKFFMIYVLGFILLGNVAATAFMSAGPFFPWHEGRPHPDFQPLLTYLWFGSETPILKATYYQVYLQQALQSRVSEFGSGISAFPSMHIAITTLYVLVAWQNRFWRYLALILLAAMLVGSVHLAWHYAIDGYVSILATIALWHCAGRFIRRAPAPVTPAPAATVPTAGPG